jgi:hypothetical protein
MVKFAIEIASEKELALTLEALKSNAAAGKLDAEIEAPTIKLHKSFDT